MDIGVLQLLPCGCAVTRQIEDFDNDGFTDIYIADGHESRQSVHDHEPEFWLHDIYVGHSRENPVAFAPESTTA